MPLHASVNRETRSFPIVISTETRVRTWLPSFGDISFDKAKLERSATG